MPPHRDANAPIVMAALSAYPPDLAGARLRVHQYGPSLAASGISLRPWSFFRSQDLPRWYGRSHVARALVVLTALARLWRLAGVLADADVVLVQRESLPFGPALLELLAARGRRLIWDVDDSVWVPYVSPTAGRVPRWLRATGDKYGTLCRHADEVWAGSEVLAAWCRERSDNVVVVPTVVHAPEDYPERTMTRTIGWIGSHSTTEFIQDVLSDLREVDPPVRVVIVGGDPVVPSDLDCDVRPWTPAAEAAALEQISVGLYPIDRDHPLAEGKCGLKAILFMAAGTPVVTTPTATNSVIVRDGVDGFHASTPTEWVQGVEQALTDADRWSKLGRAAHERAATAYSLETWGPIVARRVHDLVDR